MAASRKNLERIIAAYHIVAGAAGILVVLVFGGAALRRAPSSQHLGIELLLGLMALMFAAVTFAGVLLIERHPAGRPLATLLQLLQVFYFATASAQWLFLAGLYLGWAAFGGHSSFVFGAKAEMEIAWAREPYQTGFGVNVVPFVIIWLMWRGAPADAANTADIVPDSQAPAA